MKAVVYRTVGSFNSRMLDRKDGSNTVLRNVINYEEIDTALTTQKTSHVKL